MCGVAGIVVKKREKFPYKEFLNDMLDELTHRGPDGRGVWEDALQTVFLGHTRLAIRDFSGISAQPIESRSNKLVISYNGEIYNTEELLAFANIKKSELRGHGDTEILTEVFAKRGIIESLPHINGMFALAAIDKIKQEIVVARDRYGEKPIYIYNDDKKTIFASELKAITNNKFLSKEIDENALDLYWSLGYIPAPKTIYKNIIKLMPNYYLKISLKEEYNYSIEEVHQRKVDLNLNPNHDKDFHYLESLIARSVRDRLVSDAPIGVFLSSGIDSSILAAIASKEISQIKTFTLAFNEPDFNEAPVVSKTSKELKISNSQVLFTSKDAKRLISTFNNVYSEPFSDSSQLPTLFLARFAAQEVKVVLTGDGADELFAGYPRYKQTIDLYEKIAKFPNLPVKLNDTVLKMLYPRVKSTSNNELKKILRYFEFCQLKSNKRKSLLWLYLQGVRIFPWDLQKLSELLSSSAVKEAKSNLKTLLNWDKEFYLPGDILAKTDRSTMSFGLEARAPFLDPYIEEYSNQLSEEILTKEGVRKFPLTEIHGRIFQKNKNSPKKGFGVPLNDWLRTDLKNWADNLIYSSSKCEHFTTLKIEQLWKEQKAGANHGTQIWTYLMYISWKNNQH